MNDMHREIHNGRLADDVPEIKGTVHFDPAYYKTKYWVYVTWQRKENHFTTAGYWFLDLEKAKQVYADFKQDKSVYSVTIDLQGGNQVCAKPVEPEEDEA